jgi:lipopolysaccharide export system ATP-binding protein
MNDQQRPPRQPPRKPLPRSPLRELRERREKQQRELLEMRDSAHEAAAEARTQREPPHDAAADGREVREAPRLVAQNDGLAVHNIGKQFKKRPVLRDVSLYVQRGEVVGLLGPNGAGKTTCFYIVTGLIAPDYGMITLDGHDITELPMYRRSRLGVGYLPQEASIFRGLSVEANIRAILEVTEPEPERRDARLEELMAEFSITHLRRTPALALSGGERRRVEIARALASRPRFMLLDEPLAGIDPIAVNDIRSLVTHLKDRGIGVLITDHNVRETLDIVDRAYILHDGSVLMEGRPSEIVAHKDVRRVYLGERFSL